ncbi:MAG TPA: Ig-like domain-containing protein, partial [Yinghuangia sp.]|nr:Ig-like domain-containing protein [Yinghuangia sp.]
MTRTALSRRPLGVVLSTVALAGAFNVSASFAPAAAQPLCSTANVLDDSHFEIDANANLVVNGPAATCIDWLTGGTGSAFRNGVLVKRDRPSGANDNSFGQGTAENNPNPTIVTGSIPPNKSDLLTFGVHTENNTTPKFLELFWQRVNSPQGTTNMDFELNQKFCDPMGTPTNCANNGSVETATPVRTAGDKLITYDLSRGGTVATISIREWTGSVWGPADVISDGANPDALGSVNTTSIPANQAGGTIAAGGLGPLDPFTFGEAAISFDALFPPGSDCRTFGSAYVKSRSSDSFNSELKDFIDPQRVSISNCTSLITTATESVTIGSPISDTATLAGGVNPTGTITFRLYADAQCSTTPVFTSTVNVNGNGNYPSGQFTPTAVGTYYWTAQYSGDANNSGSTTACGDPDEQSVVTRTQPSITTDLSADSITIGESAFDTAQLANATADAGGTVTYSVFTDMVCTQGERDAGTVTVTNGVVPNSDTLTFDTLGTFYWQASYSGDANNEPATSTCESEPLIVGKADSDISTEQFMYPQDSTTVTATSGGQPTGDVIFRLFGPNDPACSNAVYTETVGLNNGQAATNNTTFAVNAANQGAYHWTVAYGGDATHNGVTSECGV